MKKLGLIVLLFIAGSYAKLSAQTPAVMMNDKSGWHKIASKSVDLKLDRDEVSVSVADRFAALKVIVKEASINLYDLEVYYEKGDKQVIEVRNPMKAGSESRVFDLKGSERDIKKIVFIYKTMPNSKDEKAELEVWGLKTNVNPNKAAVSSPAVMMSDKTGWHKIGERNVDFKTDRDDIPVVGADRFSAIKFLVTDASVELLDLEVYYESGDKQDIKLADKIMAGKESRVIDLDGYERNLKKVVFVYRTFANKADEKAHIELWGLKTNLDKK